MVYRYIVDTYAWIAYFNKKRFQTIIDHNQVETPAIVVAELVRTMIRKQFDLATIHQLINFVHSKGPILHLDFEQAARAGICAERENLSFVDGIIYSYVSSEDDRLLSGDEHFRNKKQVIFEKE